MSWAVPEYDLDAPADVFLVSAEGREVRRRVIWRMSTRDAMAVCSRKETSSEHWMIVWSPKDLVDPIATNFVEDDGRFAELFHELGVTVLMSRDCLMNPRPGVPETARLADSPVVPVQLALLVE